ncbi:hypothetical protein OnM2_053050 [Erysiphe neolycopersici]|uniref:Uncharacterized protein n=1 Tax=Erysiphe neolycopersici TaxID=212602 RepID=A0A420HRY1_9PEZI|nr:hypothetical protein OnM2_053050 [Erysiphe neolycopersici]
MIASIERSRGAVLLAEFLQDKEAHATISTPQSYTSRRGQDDTVILNTATTNHVFHQQSRFINYEKLNRPIQVRIGDSHCFIVGIGSIRLSVMTDKGERSIIIDNVQYIPGFHIKIIAYKAYKNGGAYLDGRKNWIRKIKDDSCVAICKNSACGSFLILEEGKKRYSKETSLATQSTNQQFNIASTDTWHQRLGHMSYESLAKLPNDTKGVIIKDKSNDRIRPLCEVCNLRISHTRISRQPQNTGENPFQGVHIDFIHE